VIGGDHINLKPDEFRRQLDGSAELCVRVAPLDCNIAAFDIAQVAHSRPERFSKRMRRRQRHEYTHARHFFELLRARCERPSGRRAAQTADEISTSDWTAQHVFSTLPVGSIITVSPGLVPVLG
jgi:hypothetical protein